VVVAVATLVLALLLPHKNRDLAVMSDKSYLPKLKGLVANNNQWDGFCEMLQFNIEQQQRRLEQATELREIYQAQGAITMLRQMKYLKEEINAHK
jgi:hypothetical protein